ncbi:cyclic nucleotide-binding domain-containing protein [Paenibacillus glucanolyticus]|uniref:cyclic nucleotide-binding domain-containing protein n=1 Tax=Paenibacillus glucanolyticus TaxID=59843 RepID=UPI00096ECC06|nr:cyclic nucleotide-binding domain-containing protein [Paenibacillus glucanolyticus]OMF74396.1 cyclic nucleotide-binding protein [Paenibacillus glucanolyticus]
MTMLAIDFLRNHTLFRGVPLHELEGAVQSMHEEHFNDGDDLIVEGSYGNSCYFIMSGQVQIVSRNLIGHTVTLDVLGEGALIGEVSLFLEEKRTSGAQAIGEVTALKLEQNAFSRLAAASPMFHESLSFSARIRTMHAMLSKATIWAAIPNAELRGLAEVTVRRKVYKGDVIVAEGALADRFYMIAEGRFEVRSGRRKKAIYKPGDYFGEMDLLSGDAHTGTVKALENGELMVMGRDEFHFVLQQYEPVRRQFHEVLRIRRPDLLSDEVRAKLHHTAADTVAPNVSKEAAAAVEAVNLAPPKKERWMDVLLALGGIFVVLTVLAIWLKQPLWIYAAMISGGLVGPVSFVAYMRSSQLLGFKPIRLASVFVASGIIAVPIAWMLERLWSVGSGLETTTSEHIQAALMIGVIEEIAKLLVCFLFLRGRRQRFLMDAVVFGAAAGMGFAAIESILYGYMYLQQHATSGMLAVLWVRALLSPFGHGTWTAIAAAGLWYGLRGASKRSARTNRALKPILMMISLLLLSILLHAAWDYPYAAGLWKMACMVLVGGVGIWLLIMLIRQGTKEEREMHRAVNPAQEVEARIRHAVGPNAARAGVKASGSAQPLTCEACGTVSPAGTRYCGRCGQALQL